MAGVLAGLLGIGGGVIMVPAVVMVLGLPPAVAKGTSAAVIVPTALIGTIRNRTNRNADIRVAVIVGLFGAVTAVIGALISDRLSDATSNVLFAFLLIAVAITQLMTLRFRDRTRHVRDHRADQSSRRLDAGRRRTRRPLIEP